MKIIKKPWGKEEILELNDKYCLKRLTMLEGKRCSLQRHAKKMETIYVLEGILAIVLGDDSGMNRIEFGPGDCITIEVGRTHRMEGVTDSVYLEASTPEMDDVIRIDDDYNRE
jgi:mannose-6-phosphate isomerase